MIRLSLRFLAVLMLTGFVPAIGQSISEIEYLANEADPRLTHKVVPGESLYGIARQYGLTVEELREMNGKPDDMIHPGERLLVKKSPGSESASMRLAPGADQPRGFSGASPSTGFTQVEHREYYLVREGDRIEDVASLHQVHVDQLRDWNGVGDVYPGQTLIVGKWYETVDLSQLRGQEASASLRQARSQPESPEAGLSLQGLAPVGHMSVLGGNSPWPMRQAGTESLGTDPAASNDAWVGGYSNPAAYRQPAPAAEPVQTQSGWLMERPTYQDYRASNARGMEGSSAYQRTRGASPEAVFDEMEVSGPYEVYEERYRAPATRFYALHKELPVGSKIQVFIPYNSGFVEVEVIGRLPENSRAIIALSPATAKILQGAGERDQRVTVKF